jgi:hypothetical protein
VGGSGGGGNGKVSAGQTGDDGAAFSGGGGGGGSGTSSRGNGGNGGSGVVMVAYPDTFANAVSSPGATFTNAGGYKRYIWTSSSGSITF